MSSKADTRTGKVGALGVLPPLGVTALAIAVALLGGMVGLLMMLVMALLSRVNWAVDDASSHGISERQSSRLGGVAVVLGAAVFFVTLHWPGHQWAASLTDPSKLMLPSYAWAVLLIALVGLWDDLAVQFSAPIRLLLVLSIACWAMFSDPGLMPPGVYAWIPELFNQPVWLTIAGALVVAGFVNAGNMADGANGLLASIALVFFGVAYWLTPTGYYWSAILALSVFLIVNVTTGRIFLGDFGSYAVSASVAFSGLALYAAGNVSIWLLGSLLAYPCHELVRVTVSRLLKKQSPLQAGNDHLHNRLFAYFRSKVGNQVVANSLTGCTIGLLSAVVPGVLAVTGTVDASDSQAWLTYFLAYAVLHLLAYRQLKVLNVGR